MEILTKFWCIRLIVGIMLWISAPVQAGSVHTVIECRNEEAILIDGMKFVSFRDMRENLESDEEIRDYIDVDFWSEYLGLEELDLDGIEKLVSESRRIRVDSFEVKSSKQVRTGQGNINVHLKLRERGEYEVGVKMDCPVRKSLSPVWWLDGVVVPLDFDKSPQRAFYAERLAMGSLLTLEDMMTGRRWEVDFESDAMNFREARAACEEYKGEAHYE